MNILTKKELIKQFAATTTYSLEFVTKFFNDFEDTLITCILNNEEVVLSSKIGTFVLKKRAERKIKRITDQKVITLPEYTAITFKFSKAIKDKVKELELI
jgi:nucleoid DNA-binding protein